MSNDKKKMVIIEDPIHRKIKHIATDKETSIQKEVNDILREKLENTEQEAE